MQNTRNPQNPFSPQSSTCYTLPEFTPWVILYQCNFSSSDQLNISLVQYDTHLFLVIFPLALQFPQIFIFRSNRDNFKKYLKTIKKSFFLINNSCHDWINKDEFTVSHIVPMQFLCKWSTRYIPRSFWYTFVFGHLSISDTVLSNSPFGL